MFAATRAGRDQVIVHDLDGKSAGNGPAHSLVKHRA
jgi:hypothetical protein